MGAASGRAQQEAAEWFVLLASGEANDADHRRWQAWRTAHPEHEQAWQRTQAMAACFNPIPRDQAVASITALQGTGARKASGRRKVLGQLAVLMTAGGVGSWGWRHSDRSADLVTAIGELREVTLPDGSRMSLDTASVVDIEFSASLRLIRLRRGRVLVETATAIHGHGRPDLADLAATRPFMVETAEGRVQALGTRFTVGQEAQATRVAVLESAVMVQPASVSGGHPVLKAGQAARFTREGVLAQSAVQAGDAAWAKGMLAVNDRPLDEVVAELARYRAEPLWCDASVRGLRISGAFPLRNSDAALQALVGTLPVRLERRGQALVVTSKH